MTILPLPLWAVLICVAIILTGCAPVPSITSRDCVITLTQQVAQNAFSANLLCEQEEPVKAVVK